MKLGMIMIFVSDLEEAKKFYCDVLGFSLKAENQNHLSFEHPGCDFVAFKCERDAAIERHGEVARSVFVFEVPSLERSFKDLQSKGVVFLHAVPAENDFCRYCAFRDPFGNVHEIFQRKDQSQD